MILGNFLGYIYVRIKWNLVDAYSKNLFNLRIAAAL